MAGDLDRVSAYLTANNVSAMDHNNMNTNSVVKMEDLHTPLEDISTPASLVIDPSALTESTPKKGESKPAKKRKSWGQVLPEPKTSLPPRKRAKTEDEKEQRRIERVKRNRLAAHMSRERKRQEVELLQAQNDRLQQQLVVCQDQMKSMMAELQQYRQSNGITEPLPEPPTFKAETPIESYHSVGAPSIANTSPESLLHTMDSPSDITSLPATPIGGDHYDVEAVVEPDQTQHSAAMLWDLQCQSGTTSRPSTSASRRRCFQSTMAFLFLLNLHLSSKILLPAVSMISTYLPTFMSTRPTSFWARKTSSSHRSTRKTRASLALLSSCPPTLALLLATSSALHSKDSAKLLEALHESGAAGELDQKAYNVWCRKMTRAWIRRRTGKRKGSEDSPKRVGASEFKRKREVGFDKRSKASGV